MALNPWPTHVPGSSASGPSGSAGWLGYAPGRCGVLDAAGMPANAKPGSSWELGVMADSSMAWQPSVAAPALLRTGQSHDLRVSPTYTSAIAGSVIVALSVAVPYPRGQPRSPAAGGRPQQRIWELYSRDRGVTVAAWFGRPCDWLAGVGSRAGWAFGRSRRSGHARQERAAVDRCFARHPVLSGERRCTSTGARGRLLSGAAGRALDGVTRRKPPQARRAWKRWTVLTGRSHADDRRRSALHQLSVAVFIVRSIPGRTVDQTRCGRGCRRCIARLLAWSEPAERVRR